MAQLESQHCYVLLQENIQPLLLLNGIAQQQLLKIPFHCLFEGVCHSFIQNKQPLLSTHYVIQRQPTN